MSAEVEEMPTKRQKSTKKVYDNFINKSNLSECARKELRNSFETSQPYTHAVIQGLCDASALRDAREEIISNIQATYKETDLFKVFQTGDLANLEASNPEHSSKLPALFALRDALYSPEFRKFMQDITGCGELSDKTDMSCNVYAQGGHLLCHDDVIGTRRVSYIIYLTDPDEPWTPEDGGALELFPLLEDGVTPSPLPSNSLLPSWNSMALFTVQPGRSYHSVQEVAAAEKPRLSISGWYHAGDAPEGSDRASLQQLQMKPGEDAITQYDDFEGCSTSEDLSEDDLRLLRGFINPAYLDPKGWAKIFAQFKEDGSVQLKSFLLPELSKKVLEAALKVDKEQGVGGGALPAHDVGADDEWTVTGPPHKQRYMRYKGPAVQDLQEGASCGQLLAYIKTQLLCSGAFARLLHKLTTITMLGHTGEVRRFRAGLDYTVAHYGILTQDPRLDAVLCFVDDVAEDSNAAWECGEVGGFEAYLLADESESGAAEVYRQNDEDSGVLNVGAARNCLNLVLRDEGLMKFVKYVSGLAPSSRWDVAMEYRPEDDSDEEEEEGEEGEGDE